MESEKTGHKNVELHSEELQDVMGRIPLWILRWGITLLFIIVLVILIGSGFFKYPDVVVAEMTLTGRFPVAQIVPRTSGKISKLYVTDGQEVSPNTLLAVIENPASTKDVLFLKQLLEQHKNNPNSILNGFTSKATGSKELFLGDVQPAYTSFLGSLNEYDNYHTLDYYTKKIENTRKQIGKYKAYHANLQRQQKTMERQHLLAEQQYARDSALHIRGVISSSDHDNAKASLLQSRYSLESGYASLENLLIQIGEIENNLLDLELQQAEKISVLMHNYHTATEQLVNAINGWELNYCLIAPITGRITFTNYWHENQFIHAGNNAFAIVPDEKEKLIGKALLPITNSGKVKTRQRVIIRFANFPDQEFGIVEGVIRTISLVPAEYFFQVEINLPNGLTTNFRKELPVTHEMKATAEIVTEDLSLLERFFQPLKKILKEGFD